MKEANILRKLQEADPMDKKHLIRLERTFDHRGHLCLVFESLRCISLRVVLRARSLIHAPQHEPA